MKYALSLTYLIVFCHVIVGQTNSNYIESKEVETAREIYDSAFSVLNKMALEPAFYDLKKAVFTVENAYYEENASFESFCSAIELFVEDCKNLIKLYGLDYSSEIIRLETIIALMTKSISSPPNGDSTWVFNVPFSYDFSDYRGVTDWSNMFVLKLISIKKGNCHSLPIFAKILANEMSVNAHLAYMPNHIYLKFKHTDGRWYNAELTNGFFPPDPVLTTQGYITQEAIENRVYMDKLDREQELAMCLVDLGKGHQRKFGKRGDNFVLECANLALRLSPKVFVDNDFVSDSLNTNINAMLLKANVLENRVDISLAQKGFSSRLEYMKSYHTEVEKRGGQYSFYDFLLENTSKEVLSYYKESERLTAECAWIGYEEMDDKMYQDWLMEVEAVANGLKYGRILINTKSDEGQVKN